MGKKKILPVKLFDCPEEITEDGIKIYTEKSLNNQIAILSHYLHSGNYDLDNNNRKEIVDAINEYLSYKGISEEKNITKEEILQVAENPLQYGFFEDFFKVPFPAPTNPRFTFIDLFAGIGGFRIAMQSVGGKCVYSSEFDSKAQETYFANYGEMPFGDITKESNKEYIPDDFDILCAGFPCQAFSIAGYQKGFEDTRGTLFFDVAEIVKRKRPKVVFLENVKNLYAHDGGKTFSVIKSTMEELGYTVFHKVMNAMEYANIPQNRERIFIVCFNPERVENYKDFSFPNRVSLDRTISDYIDYSIDDENLFYSDKFPHYNELVNHISSKKTIYQWRRKYVRENKSNVCPTLTANMGTGGHNVPLILTDSGIRKLSPKECINFQGFPKNFKFPDNITNSAKYKQAGNSVVVPLITEVCKQIVSII